MTEVTRFALAEEVGFEPTVPVDTAVFETARFGRSRTPPWRSLQLDLDDALLATHMVSYASTSWRATTNGSCRLALESRRDGRLRTMTCRWDARSSRTATSSRSAENRREVDHDPTAHAEIVALRERRLEPRGRWRLDDVTAYVTLEPCVMCAGALFNARVARVVIGALDEKAGAVGSRYNLLSDPRLLHEASLTYDV